MKDAALLLNLKYKDQGIQTNISFDNTRGMLRADYAYRCRQMDSLRCAQLHGDKYFTLARAAYT